MASVWSANSTSSSTREINEKYSDIKVEEEKLSVTEFDAPDFDYDSVNSPGASSTSSEPVYSRQPGFDHHAHEFRVHPRYAIAIGIETVAAESNSKASEHNLQKGHKYLGPDIPTPIESSFFHSPPQSPISIDTPIQPSCEIQTNLNVKVSSNDVQQKTKEPTGNKTRGGTHTPPGSTSKGSKKKKSANNGQTVERITAGGNQNGSPHTAKPKVKREPLPMKLRALPHSFWLQPNKTNNQPPSCSVLPPLCIGKDFSDFSEVRPVTPPDEKVQVQLKECSSRQERDEKRSDRIIRVGNTDLLFSLFDSVEKDDKRKHLVVRRGRPKKSSLQCVKGLRDEDPCLVSTATESILPLLPDRTPLSSGSSTPLGVRHAQGQQVMELINLKEGDRTLSLPSLNVDHGYSQLLSELVLKL